MDAEVTWMLRRLKWKLLESLIWLNMSVVTINKYYASTFRYIYIYIYVIYIKLISNLFLKKRKKKEKEAHK